MSGMFRQDRIGKMNLAKFVLAIVALGIFFVGLDVMIDPNVVLYKGYLVEHLAAGSMMGLSLFSLVCLKRNKHIRASSWIIAGLMIFIAGFRIAVIGFNPIAIIFLIVVTIITMGAKVVVGLDSKSRQC